jgi:hypothetical protein
MPVRVVKWTIDGSILKLSKPLKDEDKTSEIIIEAEFDLVALYPMFNEFNDVQKQGVVYFAKQKLMDCGASNIGDADGKVKSAKLKWEELLAGKWTGDRVNATGAAENKKVLADVKALAKTVTMQGLLMKKVVEPQNFTPEDEEKLNEFIVLAAKELKAKK